MINTLNFTLALFVWLRGSFISVCMFVTVNLIYDCVGWYIGEDNGTPLQCSCLEKPREGGAWWAAVHGVAKSRTQLSDSTFNFHFPLACIGEGNGTHSSQCSCLENPGDSGAWWAAVYGVAQSWTRLKRLSSSNSSRVMYCPGHILWSLMGRIPVELLCETQRRLFYFIHLSFLEESGVGEFS